MQFTNSLRALGLIMIGVAASALLVAVAGPVYADSPLYIPLARSGQQEEQTSRPFDARYIALTREAFFTATRDASHIAALLGEDAGSFFDHSAWIQEAVETLWRDGPGAGVEAAAIAGTIPPVEAIPVTTSTTRDGAQVTGESVGYVTPDGRNVGMETTSTIASDDNMLRQTAGWFLNFARCPTAGGAVPGDAWHKYALIADVTVDGIREQSSVEIKTEAKVVGYTNRGGRIESMDIDVISTLLIRNSRTEVATGRIVHYDPHSYRSRMNLQRLPINAKASDFGDARINTWGPRGRISVIDYVLNQEPVDALTQAIAALWAAADNELEAGEKYWYDQEKCLEIILDPPVLKLKPGASLALQVGIEMQDGSTVGEADLTLQMHNGGAISPRNGVATGHSPLAATLSAPGQKWQPPSPVLAIEATGHQGKAHLERALILDENEDVVYVRLQGREDRIFPVTAERTRFVFDDPEARSIKFENPYFGGDFVPPRATMRAEIRMAGQNVWQTHDWTSTPVLNWCRDTTGERLAEMVVEVALLPTELPLPDLGAPRLAATNIGCAGWEGWVESEWRAIPNEDVADKYSATVKFERQPHPTGSYDEAGYRLIAAEVTWERRGTLSTCTVKGGPTTYSNLETDLLGSFQLNNFDADRRDDSRRRYRGYEGTAGLTVVSDYTITCEQGSSTLPWHHGMFWFVGEDQEWTVSNDGKRLAGNYTTTAPLGGGQTVSWEFNAIVE